MGQHDKIQHGGIAPALHRWYNRGDGQLLLEEYGNEVERGVGLRPGTLQRHIGRILSDLSAFRGEAEQPMI